MKRKLAFFFTLFLLGIGVVTAQTQVRGTVVDVAGDPVIGVTVQIKGSSQGTVTDADGNFNLSAPSGGRLVISYVGYTTQEVPVSANVRVILTEDVELLEEVIVTAMGLRRSEKSLGYAASTVKSDEINAAVPVSVLDGLAGKVAGMNVTTGGGTGTSQKVIIRGLSSLNSNSPLYVVDGVPIRNTYSGTSGLNNATDFGTSVGDINPDDVESVTVLKGASATALYGSRAANGVILINTKRGTSNSRIQATYTGTVTATNVLRTPQFQDMFGEGWPYWDAMENGSWGPRLDGKTRIWGAPLDAIGLYDPENGVYREKPYSFIENNIRDFYETGLEYTNNVSITGGNQMTSFVISYNNIYSDGILPISTDTYMRNTFSFRGDTKFKAFKASYTINYARKDINQARGGQGSTTNGGATTFQQLVQIPVDLSISRDLQDLNSPYNNVDNYFTPYAWNPYNVLANNTSTYQDDHVYGNIELTWDIMKGLSATGRLGGDFTNTRTYAKGGIFNPSPGSWTNSGGRAAEPGFYGERMESFEQIEAIVLLNADYALTDDFRVTGSVGWNLFQMGTSFLNSNLTALNVPGWYSLENGTTLPTTTSFPKSPTKRSIGALLNADISFRNWAFLGINLRNDWSSTLPLADNSYFYWGLNGSAILTDAIEPLKENEVISFLKVRGGWGETGNDAPTYRTYSNFQPTKIGLGFGNLNLPINNVAGLTENNLIPSLVLRPEITTEKEVGIDLRMFRNRLGIDFAWYTRDTKDQIISASVAPETGYTTRTQNIGLFNNKGVELRLYGTPVKLKDFSWDLGMTYSKNTSEVKELWDGADEYTIASAYDVTYKLIKGKPLGQFQVPKIRKTEDGKTVVNANGLPVILANEFETLGTSSPDFMMGFTTGFTYKSISLNALVDWRKGGFFYSNTARMLDWNGNGRNTLFNERQPFLVPNSVKLVSEATATAPAVFAENDIPLLPTGQLLSYYNYSSANKGMESNAVLDRSYVKLREITLNYKLPVKWFANTPIGSLDVSIIGRNLFMWTAAENNYVDPEITNYGNDLASELGEFSAAPSLRSFGGSLKVTF